jgi:hypothetical protein
MPLTPFQKKIAGLLAVNRSPDSYLAGGAALHLLPNSKRFSNDLDYFHDSEKRVAEAYAADQAALESHSITVALELAQPGYIRALAKQGKAETKIEWARDSDWRFMPTVKDRDAGYILHPVDLALNKILALAGRDEARDFFDVLCIHDDILSLGALIWAAAGKDPGFTPMSLLELLKRRGHHRPEDFKRLRLAQAVELEPLKKKWLAALDEANRFLRNRPPDELGCLYYSPSLQRFVTPGLDRSNDVITHFGRPGGILPRIRD